MSLFDSRRTAVAALAAALLAPGLAHADDRASAQEILASLDPASTDDAVKQAKNALERATRMHVAGDDRHAVLAEGLALEWAQSARDRARTLATEKDARATELAAIEAVARVEREHALLEEAIARSGRLRAELAAVNTKEEPRKTSSTATKPSVKPAKAPGASAPSDADAPSSPPVTPATPAPKRGR